MARQNRTKQLKRDHIFAFICRYASEHKGNSPSIRHIGREFGIRYESARFHILELMNEGRLRLEDNQLIVEDAEWIPPEYAGVTP